jgi:hypothetical protein
MPEPHLRASDADRAAVADVLGGHMSAGRLTVAEYDDRLARTYASRTYGELAELTADLPAAPPAPVAPEPVAAPVVHPAAWGSGWGSGWGHGWPAHGGGGRAAWASWLSTAVLVIGIWAITSIASGGWIYPWPIWVIGPWGLVLLSQTVGGRPGRDRQRDRGRAPQR